VFLARATGVVPVIAGRRLRAPRQHGSVFADPPLAQAAQFLASPPHFADVPIAGRSLLELRRLAAEAAFRAGQTYLNEAGQPYASPWTGRFLAAGHQPEMFHPGVWVKNFALQGLARAADLTPLNLIVDNDTVKPTFLTVPGWPAGAENDAGSYRLEKVAFDDWPGEVPYEECRVRDEQLFGSLVARAEAWTGRWPFKPLLAEYWAEVMRHNARTPLLGERLVAGRRVLERRWGCHNLEVPVSRLCEAEPFAWFVAHLFADADRFHATYNEVVHEYRRAHHLRSRNHPVPDLEADADWLEMPLWAWKSGARRRGRVFVRQAADAFELRVDGQAWPRLPRRGAGFAEAWMSLARDGFKVRSRALTTTLYTRLLVADSFIHGIGGGKYDELTDELLRRFFGVLPPRFIVLSATLLLPLTAFAATAEQECRLRHQLRDLRWNPQRHLSAGAPGAALASARTELLDRDKALPPTGRDRHLALRQLTAELQPFVAATKGETEAALAGVQAQLRASAVLQRRDFAFCLYPADLLQPFCQQFLGPITDGASAK
jgi:hypothetical protein